MARNLAAPIADGLLMAGVLAGSALRLEDDEFGLLGSM
jgi:hypothetical protein